MTGGGANMAYRGLSQHVNFDAIPDPEDRFALEELIGEGTYGEVYSARDKETGERVAIKILENVADNIEEIEEEFLVLRDLSGHPNIPAFHGLFLKRAKPPQEEDQLWFVMEVGCSGTCVLWTGVWMEKFFFLIFEIGGRELLYKELKNFFWGMCSEDRHPKWFQKLNTKDVDCSLLEWNFII